jgi:hypothetical protein
MVQTVVKRGQHSLPSADPVQPPPRSSNAPHSRNLHTAQRHLDLIGQPTAKLERAFSQGLEAQTPLYRSTVPLIRKLITDRSRILRGFAAASEQ